ncbi:MAG: UvrD-helicase domain-containing protein, partial [Bryobacteraceae bacterium]
MILAPAQQKAVERTGQDVCVVAGPGSGKTRVLVERFGWLVKQHHVAPLRILAITFTEKAATEIKQRLINAFSDDETTRAQIERAYVSTIHGFCARLLREYSVAAGVDPEFAVLDEPESALALTEVTHAVLEKLYQERPAEFQRLLEATQFSNDLADCLMSAYQARRVTGATLDRTDPATLDTDAIREVVREVEVMLEQVPPAGSDAQRRRVEKLRGWLVEARALEGAPLSAEHFRVLSDFGCSLTGLRNGNLLHDVVGDLRDNRVPAILAALAGTYYASSRGLLVDALERIDEAYQSRKRELSALDFSDLEERAIELLEGNSEALRSVRGNFDYVLMDELQDTNPLQWRIVNLIRSPGRFFAVGDINQSIYGFRNAAPGAFQDYRRDVENAGHEVDELDENYRSRAQVLAAAEYILRGAEGIEARTLTAKRAFPEKPEPCVEIIAARGDDSESGRELEAQWIARRIRELEGALKVGSGEKEHTARFRDFAILVRTSKALEPIERALKRFHVPYLTTGGRTFYEAREVRDLILLLRVIANPRDEIALAGVLRSPLAGVCDETLLRMKSGGGLTRALQASALGEHEDYDAAELERLRRFRELLASLRGVRDDISPDRLLLRAIDASGYEERLDTRARANVDKLLGIIRGWWSTRRGSVDELVANLAWRREAAPETDAPPDDSS